MSSAFVKEDSGGRWEAPVVYAYQVREAGDPEVLRQSNDLLDLLHWLSGQDRGNYEVRDQLGLLIASSQTRSD